MLGIIRYPPPRSLKTQQAEYGRLGSSCRTEMAAFGSPSQRTSMLRH